MVDFWKPYGDRLPALAATFTNDDGTAVNLTTATAITFTLKDINGAVVINAAACTPVNLAAGQVEYAWSADDAALPKGDYFGRFTASFGAGIPASVPTDRWLVVCVS